MSLMNSISATIQRAIAIALIVAVFFVPAHAADQEPVSSMLKGFQVVTDANGKEVFKPANRVLPGGLIEYRVMYRNNTDAALPDFTVNGAVPDKTAFVASSQKSDLQTNFEAEIADLGWVSLPAYREVTQPNGSVTKVEVPAAEYLNVRWVLAKSLPAQSEVNVIYRVRIDK